MNLFFLDKDIDKAAEYHIDRHVTKMQLEAAQLLATTLWIDKEIGFVPEKVNSEQLAHLKKVMAEQPSIENRTFVRYKMTHPNHPSAIWTRQSLDNFEWVSVYVNALNEESQYRGYKPHASCAEANKMPSPTCLPRVGLTPFMCAMPEELKLPDPIEAYRLFYHLDKAAIPATWKVRGPPSWWNEDIALRHERYTNMSQKQKDDVISNLRSKGIL